MTHENIAQVAHHDMVKDIARVTHEVNRAYCRALGDDSQPSWENAQEWQRKSAINGVKSHIANPYIGPAESHENWMQEKLNDGWRWGAVKDLDAKEHPCLVPFDELPVEQKAKDYIFRAVVHALYMPNLTE